MAKPMTCQEQVRIVYDVEIQTTEPCGASVQTYRTCGRGCKHTIAYCDQCGGDARSQQEMRRHHETQHPEAT